MDMEIRVNDEVIFDSFKDFAKSLKANGIRKIFTNESVISAENKQQIINSKVSIPIKEKVIKFFNCYEYCQKFVLTIDDKDLDIEIWDFIYIISNIELGLAKSLNFKSPEPPDNILSMYELDNILTIMRLFEDNLDMLIEERFFDEKDDDPFI